MSYTTQPMLDGQTTAQAGDSLARLRERFNLLSELQAGARAAWLASNVSDPDERIALERLMALDSSDGGFLDTPIDEHVARLVVDDPQRIESLVGQRIGSFRLTRLLGKGGMAAVFLGERDDGDFRQHVAVKLLRRGLYSQFEQRLFRRERQLLASLDHPNIAHLIDGGITAAGVPYLVIEFVDGVSITRYASEGHLNVRQRLHLMLIVCRAVEAAHRALIVHRDIKPANVLVAYDGTVKLLDFGIAKLLEDETDTATFGIFTPNYAAPEQIAGAAVTTATDVYALGVLLHELLLGVRPQEFPPRRPSSVAAANADANDGSSILLARELRGDLDTILLKALSAEPELRYPSAGALANDIERHLDGLPVTAHPPSKLYRTRKFVQRHRGGVAITFTLLLAILAALASTLWQANIARHELERANAMRDFMFSAFAESEPSTPRAGPPSITEVVDEAIAKARMDARMDLSTRTELLTDLGAVLRRQGHLESARDSLRWNVEQAQNSLGTESVLTREAGYELVEALILTGDFAQARERVEGLMRKTPQGEKKLRARLLMSSAMLATKQGERTRALSDGMAGLQAARSSADAATFSDVLEGFGNVQLSINDIPGAIDTYEELLAERRHQFGPTHIFVATAESALSRAYRRAGQFAPAEQHARAAVAIDEAALPKDHWRRSVHLNALVMVLRDQRDYRGALDIAKEDLRISRIALGEGHPDIALGIYNVGMLHVLLEDYADAVPLLREALTRYIAAFGADKSATATARVNYGFALAESGDAAAGEAELRQGLAVLDAAVDVDPTAVDPIAIVTLIGRCSRLKLDQHAPAAALLLLDRLDTIVARFAKPDFNWEGRGAMLRATAKIQLGDDAAADALLSAAAAALARATHSDSELQTEVPLLRARVAATLADRASVQRYAAVGLERLAVLRNPPHRLTEMAASLHHDAEPAAAPARDKPP